MKQNNVRSTIKFRNGDVVSCTNMEHAFCPRRIVRSLIGWPKSGEGYWLCLFCSPRYHSEIRTMRRALNMGYDLRGTTLELSGHWHACEPCKEMARKHNVKIVILNKK